ncbi:MAG: RluA family pseudouridine synthase [Pirellulales bacterium]
MNGHRQDAGNDEPATGNADHFQVPITTDKQRLDVFLASQYPQVSRARIRRGIDDHLATVDGKVRKASYRVAAEQSILFTLPSPPPDGPQPEPIALELLYEDEVMAVVNKPSGMVVHPAKGHWSGTMASALVHHFSQLSSTGGATRPGIVHRLDRDTSGAIVVAKTDASHENLARQFQARTVQKQYVAVVRGSMGPDRDQIDQPIGNHPSQRQKKAIRSGHPSSRSAQTFVEVLERFPGLTLVQAFPKTGRTHQIRLHLGHLRCPVLCDKLYGGQSRLTLGELRTLCHAPDLAAELPAEHCLLERQALHAQRIAIAHPTTGAAMEFTAPLPADLEQLLKILRDVP